MRKLLIAAMTVLGLGLCAAPAAVAAPISPAPIVDPVKANPLVEDVRLYCKENATGRFLHWGPCAHDRWRYRPRPYYRPYYAPRRHYYRPHHHRPRYYY